MGAVTPGRIGLEAVAGVGVGGVDEDSGSAGRGGWFGVVPVARGFPGAP
ncbi:hypothetical protein ACFWVF_03175 [Streptomyces sp. NPDC058659]